MRKPDPVATKLIFEHCGHWSCLIWNRFAQSTMTGTAPHKGASSSEVKRLALALPAIASTTARFRFHSSSRGNLPCFKLQVRCCVIYERFCILLRSQFLLNKAGAWAWPDSPHCPCWYTKITGYQRFSNSTTLDLQGCFQRELKTAERCSSINWIIC